MASLIDRDHEPSARELRWFGVLFLGFCCLVAWVVHARAGRVVLPVVLLVVATLLTAAYYALPGLQRALLRAWVTATYPIGWVGSHLALGVFFYLVLTPIGVLMRIFGRDPLERRLERERATYWVPYRAPGDVKRYWNQY